MAPRRLFIPGLSHHVWHRGNNRCDVYRDDGDRSVFLVLLGLAAQRSNVQVHGYVLMDTHYHALVTAAEEEALPEMMQRLGRAYVRHFNDRHLRTGTLWEGRYRAALICDERRWLTCLRYIELNPVEAGMVKAPEACAWSSYRHHALGEPDPLLSAHPLIQVLGGTSAQRQREWKAFCGQGTSPEERELILSALRRNASLHRPGQAESLGTIQSPAPIIPAT